MRMITFLSDFGYDDVFVGLCHAVIAAIAPDVPVIDLTHAIPPQDVLRGALALADSVSSTPGAVHLAVVDPGVGSRRRGVVVVTEAGTLVGPDNGLLLPAVHELGGINAVFELREPRYRRERVARTFHGRDVFAPAAAHLARGAQPETFGPRIRPETLVEVPVPVARVTRGLVAAQVRAIDRFGNIQLPVRVADLERAELAAQATIELVTPVRRLEVPRVATFSELEPGAIGLLEDAFGWIAISVNRGSAAAVLSLSVFDDVRLALPRAP